MLYFDNFFNSPTLIGKFFDRGVYRLITVQSDQKNMAIMKKDIKRCEVGFQYANNLVPVKWFDNRRLKMCGACLDKYNKVLTVTRNVKNAKIPFSCPEIIKDHNSGMDGVDLLDQK